jgi:HD-like signal output (HDOD) protein
MHTPTLETRAPAFFPATHGPAPAWSPAVADAPQGPVRNLDAVIEELGACQREPAPLSPELREACRLAVDHSFALNDPAHPAVAELRRLALARALRLCQAGLLTPKAPGGPETGLADLDGHDPERQDSDGLDQPLLPAELLHQAVDLTPAPAALPRLLAELDNPRSGPVRLAEALELHPELSDLILALANSRAYALPSPASSVQRAILFLGYRELRSLILGLAGLLEFRDHARPGADAAIWRRALACGFLNRTLAARAGLRPGSQAAAGLLHEAGRMLLRRTLPRQAERAARLALATGRGLSECEREVLGLDGPALGAALLAAWGASEPLCEMVARRNDPLEAEDVRSASVLHLAAITARALDAGQPGAPRLPALDPGAFEASGLTPAALGQAFTAAAEDLEAMAPHLPGA